MPPFWLKEKRSSRSEWMVVTTMKGGSSSVTTYLTYEEARQAYDEAPPGGGTELWGRVRTDEIRQLA